MDTLNRRQFERMILTDRAMALDSAGSMLGNVRVVGGGGMLVCECGPEVLATMTEGRKMRVTIVEPDLGTSNVMDVEVRYIEGNSVGMQFVSLNEFPS